LEDKTANMSQILSKIWKTEKELQSHGSDTIMLGRIELCRHWQKNNNWELRITCQYMAPATPCIAQCSC